MCKWNIWQATRVDPKPAERDVQRIKFHVNTTSEQGVKKGSLALFIRLDDLILSWSDYNKFMFSSKNGQPTPGFNLFFSPFHSLFLFLSVHSVRDLYRNEGGKRQAFSGNGGNLWVRLWYLSVSWIFFFFFLSLPPSGFYPLLAKVLPWSEH